MGLRDREAPLLCYGDEEKACIYAMYLTTADQSTSRFCLIIFI